MAGLYQLTSCVIFAVVKMSRKEKLPGTFDDKNSVLCVCVKIHVPYTKLSRVFFGTVRAQNPAEHI